MNRRDFLAQTAGAVVGATVAPLLANRVLGVVYGEAVHIEPIFPVWHRGGCEGIAFWLREPGPDVIMNAATIVYDDGRELVDDDGTGETGTLLTCQSCETHGGYFNFC